MAAKEMNLIRWPIMNPDSGQLRADVLNWAELEPEKDVFDFKNVEAAFTAAEQIGSFVLLRIDAEMPQWSQEAGKDYAGLLRALGNVWGRDKTLFSIDITLPRDEKDLADSELSEIVSAYMQEFPHSYKLLDIRAPRTALLLKGKKDVGLLLDTRHGYADIDEILEASALGEVWKTAPVRLIADDNTDEMLLREAIRLHVGIIEMPDGCCLPTLSDIGHRLELRRISFPETVCPRGKARLSLRLANSGSAPCYTDIHLRVRLSRPDTKDEMICEIKLGKIMPGEDMLLDEELTVEELPAGSYDLHLGFFGDDIGYPIVTGTDGRISDGYYTSFLQVLMK